MTFQDLNLHKQILLAIEEAGYVTPTPIQQKAIPAILSGVDIRASAQTGTGKTAAFILPALQRLIVPSPIRCAGPRVLILVPTRELAMQVAAEAIKYSKHLSRMKTVCVYGGVPYPTQIRELSRPHEILVATPGRLIDHLEQGRVNFARLEMFVLDEADRMLDMGFFEPVKKIAAALPKSRQTLLFSATLKGPVLKLSESLLKDPVEISVVSTQLSHENIEQRLHYVDNIGHKHRLLDQVLCDPTINQAIVFISTKFHADQLVEKLFEQGHHVGALHGDMNQRQRSRRLSQLRQGEIRILVATDVAARGIDVQTISHVINFDLPRNAEDYVHRIGRTGRAGAKGIALSFASFSDASVVKRIEQFTGQKIATHVIPGMEPRMGNKSNTNGHAPRHKPKPHAPGSRHTGKFSSKVNDRRQNTKFKRSPNGPKRLTTTQL